MGEFNGMQIGVPRGFTLSNLFVAGVPVGFISLLCFCPFFRPFFYFVFLTFTTSSYLYFNCMVLNTPRLLLSFP